MGHARDAGESATRTKGEQVKHCMGKATRIFIAACAATLVFACAAALPERAFAAPGALQTVEALDGRIEDAATPEEWSLAVASGSLAEDRELLVLQRNLVSEIGYEKLAAYADESVEKADFLAWFLSDLPALRYYVTGGEPNVRDGRASADQHVGALDILRRLRAAHPEDLAGAEADVHLRMMVSASLAQSGRSRLWSGDPGFVSDPLVRYETIKIFRDNDERYRFQKDLFDELTVENMRWVFESQITDSELPWLANYTLAIKPDQAHEKDRLNAYTYIWYGGVNGNWTSDGTYSYKGFYDASQFDGPVTEIKPSGENGAYRQWQGGWKEKYKLDYEDENFPNRSQDDPFYIGCGQISSAPGATTDPAQYHRLWMVFEKGGVCGALAKTFSNLNCMVGVPSAVMGQPGHAATMTYELRADAAGEQKGAYRIQNDVSGWSNSDVPSAAHYLNNWNQQRKSQEEYIRSGTYTVYAQDALNDFDSYVQSYELRLLADSFASLEDKQALLDASLAAQDLNYDAITAKIGLYEQKGAGKEEWLALAQHVADALAYYPLPMHDFMKVIDERTKGAYVVELEDLRVRTLQKASKAAAGDVLQPEVSKAMANALLGKSDGYLATFSFDGADANTIKLGAQFASGGTPWEYSLDGGSSWKQLVGGQVKEKLTDEQVASITPENDILVRFIGSNTINAIDIGIASKELPRHFLNDRTNALYFEDSAMPAKIETRIGDGAWTRLTERNLFPGDVDVQVRRAASGTMLPSDPTTLSFSEDAETGMTFVPYGELNVNSYSSSQNGEDGARRVLDASALSYWHNAWSGNDYDGWIVIDLGRERDIAAFDFWPRPDHGNGTPRNKVIVSAAPDAGAAAGVAVDADAFSEVKEASGFSWKAGKPARVAFDEPVTARYIKLQTQGDKFFSCSLLDFFEDASEVPILQASAVDLGSVQYGSSAPSAVLTLANAGTARAFVDGVRIVSSEDGAPADAFSVSAGAAEIAPGAQDAGWSIAAKPKLAAGVYAATAVVSYHADGEEAGAREARAEVVLEVTKKVEHDLALFVEMDGSTARLSLSGADDAKVQYALCTIPEHPADDAASVAATAVLDTWTFESEFSGLSPDVEYHAFARTLEDANHAQTVMQTPVKVVVPQPDGGGAGQGGESNGGSDGNDQAPDENGQGQVPDGNGGQGGQNPDGGGNGSGGDAPGGDAPDVDGGGQGSGPDDGGLDPDGGQGGGDSTETPDEGGSSNDDGTAPDSNGESGGSQPGQGGSTQAPGAAADPQGASSAYGKQPGSDVLPEGGDPERFVPAMSDATAPLVVGLSMTALVSLTAAVVALRMRGPRRAEDL